LASTDSLTGARSKRYLLNNGEAYINDPANHPVQALILDLDHFKHINDHYGHITGDHILAALGDVLNENFKDSMVVRFGGEEFAILIPNCSNREAHERADALRRIIENLRPEDIPITASIGLSSLQEHPGASLSRLLGFADKALYAAKNGGRNRVANL
ncbi:MAG: GGDEF domain-containing protein, partial [Gammaproteobacteria bacterium]|nr:GGDEF domain-containing protein [Gammaproteobacteria bacterium]